MMYRSQNWLNNRTPPRNHVATASYVTGSHSLKFGIQGHWWRDDREIHTNTQRLQYTFVFGNPVSITQYASPYEVNARAMQVSFFVQDQWTLQRLTLQGALRYDRPWSWFPEQNQPASRFFPGATFPRTEGVTGYHDITPRMGAAYDVFGTGRTALRVNLGKYLQGASVSNLAYGSNPALRIPGGGGGIFPPSVSRSWTDANADFIPDCDLTNPLANGDFVRPDQQPPVRQQPAHRRAVRSGPLLRLGRPSVRLVVRGLGPAGDRPACLGRSRLQPPLVHACTPPAAR
jgi:hypothetical protein